MRRGRRRGRGGGGNRRLRDPYSRDRARGRNRLARRTFLWRPHQGLCREAGLMRLDILKAMNLARVERRAGAIVTRLSDGDQRFVRAESVDVDPLAAELEAALRMGKSATVAHQGE